MITLVVTEGVEFCSVCAGLPLGCRSQSHGSSCQDKALLLGYDPLRSVSVKSLKLNHQALLLFVDSDILSSMSEPSQKQKASMLSQGSAARQAGLPRRRSPSTMSCSTRQVASNGTCTSNGRHGILYCRAKYANRAMALGLLTPCTVSHKQFPRLCSNPAHLHPDVVLALGGEVVPIFSQLSL